MGNLKTLQLFPELDKIVFLDDDVVVQRDLSPLWSLRLNGKVNGAVSSWIREGDESSTCFGRVLGEHLNFSNPEILSSKVEENQCGWLYGMNIFDLDAWRATNITQVYHQWLKLVSCLFKHQHLYQSFSLIYFVSYM